MEDGSPTPSSWMNHPVYAAAIGVAAGVAFAIQFLMPAHLGNLRYEVDDARKQIAEFKRIEERARLLEKELVRSRRQTAEAQLTSLLTFGSPYPTGLSQIKIGDSTSQIDLHFPGAIDKGKQGYWSVETGHAHIRSATYYFSPSDAASKITRVTYFIGSTSPLYTDDLAKSRYIDSLGLPQIVTEDGEAKWVLPSGLVVTLNKWWITIAIDTNVTSSIVPRDRSMLKARDR